MNYKEKIETLCERHKLTKWKLAKVLGIEKSTIYALFNNRNKEMRSRKNKRIIDKALEEGIELETVV